MDSLPFHFKEPLVMNYVLNLSDTIITKAVSLAKDAEKYETMGLPETHLSSKIQLDHRGSVVASLILSVSYLESFFNEFLTDLLNKGEKIYPDLDGIKPLLSSWNKLKKKLKQQTTVNKYQWMLEKLGITKISENSNTYRNANKLRMLRNHLVHYRPEPIPMMKIDLNTMKHLEIEKHKLEKELEGLFPVNPFVHPSKPFFPSKCLGSGCAKWGTQSAIDYIEEFKSKLGME